MADFIDAALVFSGAGEADLPKYRARIEAVVIETKNSFGKREKKPILADELLAFLHKKYLEQYSIHATSLPGLLENGRYNCLSSSILYLIAADALGIRTVAVRTKDHAFVKVVFTDQAFDVETTSRFGFDPGKKKEFLNEFGRVTGFMYSPPGNYRDRRDIGRRELLSLILNNRIGDLIAEKKYDAAVGPGVDFFELLKNEESLKILSGIFSEISRHALATRQYQAGYELLNAAASRYREFEQFQEIRRFFIYTWCGALIEAGSFTEAQSLAKKEYAQGKISSEDYRKVTLFRFHREAETSARDPRRGTADALQVIAEAKKELGDEESLLKAEKTFAYNRIIFLIGKGQFEEAGTFLEQFLRENKLGNSEFTTLYVFLSQKRAEVDARSERYREALLIIEEGIGRIGRDKALLQSAAVYAHNFAIRLLKTEMFEQARQFIEGEKAAAYLAPEARQDLLLFYFNQKAESLKKQDQPAEAIGTLEEGIVLLGKKPALLRNYEVSIHNYMLGFYDKNDLAQAEAVLRRGLSVYPESSLLKSDVEKVKNK